MTVSPSSLSFHISVISGLCFFDHDMRTPGICGNVQRHIPGTFSWVTNFTRRFWETKWQTTPVFLPGESHRQRSLAGYSPWGYKESDMTELLTD